MLPDNRAMQRAEPVPPPPRPSRTWAERVFGHWWRRQSAAHQDRYATLGPLLSVLLFLAAIVSAFWYLRNEEFDREQEAVRRDTEVAQQQVRLRLIENHEQLIRMARELVGRTLDHDAFLVQAAAFTLEHPEVSNLIWLNDKRVRIGGYAGTTFPPETGIGGVDTPASLPIEKSGTAPEEAFLRARETRQTAYSQPFPDSFGNGLFWMVMLLSALTVWMLLGTWRHMHRRLQMQATLVSETNFRRAMENSMLTGMRAMDREGRISYVNPAFCAMTGFSETDLIGQQPPFPYWPHERVDENARLLEQELQGKSPTGGIEVKVMRKDGP